MKYASGLSGLLFVHLISATILRTRATDFVGVSDQKFTLNGDDFVVAGTNAYWLAQESDDDIDTALTDIVNAGLTVVRTWQDLRIALLEFLWLKIIWQGFQ